MQRLGFVQCAVDCFFCEAIRRMWNGLCNVQRILPSFLICCQATLSSRLRSKIDRKKGGQSEHSANLESKYTLFAPLLQYFTASAFRIQIKPAPIQQTFSLKRLCVKFVVGLEFRSRRNRMGTKWDWRSLTIDRLGGGVTLYFVFFFFFLYKS